MLSQINQNLFNSCKQILDVRFNGVIKKDKHCEGSHECCILELYSVVLNKSWTDDPNILRIFDIRQINDIDVLDSLRTEWMLKLLCAYEGSLDWPVEKQKEVVSKIVILTVNRIISKLPGLNEKTREACISAKTLEEAKSAANAAAANYAAAYDAAANYAAAYAAANYAAYSAANYAALAKSLSAAANSAVAADYAAAAADYVDAAADYVDAASKEEIFVETCKLWLEAAGY